MIMCISVWAAGYCVLDGILSTANDMQSQITGVTIFVCDKLCKKYQKRPWLILWYMEFSLTEI